VTILMVVISAVFFYAEQTVMQFDDKTRTWLYQSGEKGAFQSIPASFWWFIATVTTVGYGDVFPHSDMGKFVAAFTMVGGLFVLAVPVAVFSLNFSAVWDERIERLSHKYRKSEPILISFNQTFSKKGTFSRNKFQNDGC